MKCAICGNNVDGVYEAIYGKGVVEACKSCIIVEGLSPIPKPTQYQLERANQRYTVHDRMMKLSGLDKQNPISKDHEIAQRHIAKIRVPEKKQLSELLFPNYDWTIMMARRRRKITITQLSEITNIPINEIESMEKGILPKNFEKNARILEEVLGVLILKESEKKSKISAPEKIKTEEEKFEDVKSKLFGEDLNFNERQKEIREENLRKQQIEQEIREAEKIAMSREEKVDEKAEFRKEIRKEISTGKFDFSDKEKLKNVTLNDLIDIKIKKEREELEKKDKGKI